MRIKKRGRAPGFGEALTHGNETKIGVSDAYDVPPRRYPTLIVVALVVAEVTAAFETATIYAGMNKLIAAFGDPISVGWLITSYLLIAAGSAAVAGRLGDIYGRRKVILILLSCGVIGSLISVFGAAFAVVLIGRSIQGLTGAILPLCIGLVREHLPARQVPMGVGLMVSGASGGAAAGLVIGGLVVDAFSWHAMFVASAILGAFAFVLTALFVPVSKALDRSARLDWFGGLMFVPGIAGLLLCISKGKDWGWFDPALLLVATISTGSLIAWVFHALRTPDPLIDVRLFLNRRVAVANAVTALIAAGSLQVTMIFSVMLQAPSWTGVGLGLSATTAGLVKLPSNVGALMAGPFSGWLIQRSGARIVMALAGVICAMAWTCAALFHESVPMLILILIVMTFGATMIYAVGPNLVVESAPLHRTSEAVGMLSVVRSAAIGIGAQIMSVLLASDTVRLAPGAASYPSEQAVTLTMWVVVATVAAATLLAFSVPRGRTAQG